jgi:hypothetical protein
MGTDFHCREAVLWYFEMLANGKEVYSHLICKTEDLVSAGMDSVLTTRLFHSIERI